MHLFFKFMFMIVLHTFTLFWVLKIDKTIITSLTSQQNKNKSTLQPNILLNNNNKKVFTCINDNFIDQIYMSLYKTKVI